MKAEAHRDQLKPDLDEARKFLEALDPSAKYWCFQTFYERDDKNLPAQHKTGTLDDLEPWLVTQNRKKYGVYVTVNETDGKGRELENITRIRAVFVDLDGSPLEPVKECGLTPNIIVETSPGRWHAYWMVDGLAPDLFNDVQRSLEQRFNGCEGVKGINRVMRLPGFFHCKGEPVRTKLLEVAV